MTLGKKLLASHLPAIIAWLLAAAASPMIAIADDSPKRPNILLIFADDLGFSDLGCYGGEIETPNLDALAAGGLRLTHLYNTGRCCPSRASLMTGQYPHRVGLGHMVKNLGTAGYRGRLSPEARTVADLLRPAGYATFLSGKWHLGTDDPTQNGFDGFYGTLISAQTYWEPAHFQSIPPRDASADPENFYGTTALTDRAIEFIDDSRAADRPWFLYLSYHTPHFPLHAPAEDIAKYSETYQAGWDVIRSERHRRMKQLGVIPEDTELPPRSNYTDWQEEITTQNPPWDSLPEPRRRDLARRMAIYAAMVDNMDRNIGRVVERIREHDELADTLIIFLSDNGACAEWDPFGFDGRSGPDNKLHQGEELDTMGGPGTYHSVGSGWANASNTPWRYYKHYTFEGGISTPCIIHWPRGVPRGNEFDATPGHVIDILPTLLSGASVDDAGPIAPAGVDLTPIFSGGSVDSRPLYFEHEGHRAVIDFPWKLTAIRGGPWQLYDLRTDRTEMKDLSPDAPERVERMSKLWQEWAEANDVLPFPDDYQVGYLKTED